MIPGMNDTWNVYQKFKRGLSARPAEWQAARAALRCEYEDYIAGGGVPLTMEAFFPAQVSAFLYFFQNRRNMYNKKNKPPSPPLSKYFSSGKDKYADLRPLTI